MKTFANLTSLRSLDFSKNNLWSPVPTLDNLTSLNVLNFSTNELREPFPTTILNLKALVELRMDNNFFDPGIPEEISNLQMLEQLNLHSARLRGTLPEAWGQNFTKLERLHLHNNELTGSIPESWKSMTKLREFRLKNNQLTGPVPTWVNELPNTTNTNVDFYCNYLTGTMPTTFEEYSWLGNCFHTDKPGHDQKCGGDTCSVFLSGGSKKKAVSSGTITGIVIAAIVCVLAAILGVVFWLRPGASNKRKRRRGGAGDWTEPQGVRRFSYREVAKATKTFDKSCVIGEGGFGKVYMAQLDDGKRLAVKRGSDVSFQGTKEFHNEITLLSRLHHRHLVRLEGFCDDQDEQILVYEYMSNGNLHRHLLNKHASTLNWNRRLEIALAVAQGLDYLHTFADPPVIHRDVKPSNILLDDNMVAKVSDFGISKANPEMDTHLSTRPAGTAGYLDPEYFLRRQLTTASDVYGYGVVLLELITGQLAIDHKRLEDYNLVGWVKPKLVRKGIHAIIDPRLGPNFPAEQYEEVAHLAMGCTAYERGDRPTMQTVSSTLERILSGLIPPPEHLMPTTCPSLYPLIKGQNSNSQMSSDGTENMSDVKLEFGSRDTVVEPR